MNKFILYPNHGPCQVINIEQKKLDGNETEVLILKSLITNIFMILPVKTLTKNSIRELINPHSNVVVLYTKSETEGILWNMRDIEYLEKIDTGDILELIEVVNSIISTKNVRSLTRKESRIYRIATKLVNPEDPMM
jgi:RNA polymerase-interacting CarD/CdnL/TRCF family regulator